MHSSRTSKIRLQFFWAHNVFNLDRRENLNPESKHIASILFFFGFAGCLTFGTCCLCFYHIRQSIGTQSRTIRHLISIFNNINNNRAWRAWRGRSKAFTTNFIWIKSLFLVPRRSNNRNHIFKRSPADSLQEFRLSV